MSQDHEHAPPRKGRVFLVATALNLAYVAIQVGFGIAAHSTALLADAAHNFSDVLGGRGQGYLRRSRSERSPSSASVSGNGEETRARAVVVVPGKDGPNVLTLGPSLVVILHVGYFGRRTQHPRVRGMLQCVVLASATLLVLAALPIGRDALNGPLTIGITIVALPLLLAKRIDTLWLVAGATALSFTGSMIGVAQLDRPTPGIAQRVIDHREDGARVSCEHAPRAARPASLP